MTKTLTKVQNNALSLVTFALVSLVFLIPTYANAALLTQTLDFGESNPSVTALQTYLSLDSSLYPSGLVTGYFGPLTQAGVERFQAREGIVSSGTPATTGYGRVGPRTLARLNALIGGGSTTWDASPRLSDPVVGVTSTSATIEWTTNEPTIGQVYWSTSPLIFNEASGPRQQPYVSGTLAVDSVSRTNHTISLSNLQPNTTYYYLVRGVDSVGNMSMVWPQTFHTNN